MDAGLTAHHRVLAHELRPTLDLRRSAAGGALRPPPPEPARPTSATDPVHQSILSDLEGAPDAGARPTLLHGSRADFGDPAAELDALQHGAALLDATDGGCVRIAGPDAADFLQRVLAGDVRALAPGDARPNLLLSSKGKVRASFELLRLAEGEFLALCAPGAGAGLTSILEKI